MYKKYRFRTKSVDDYRPLVDMKDIQMPWWCTGEGDGYVTIMCYLPENENIYKYWDDAYYFETESVNEITYTIRFPKPSWIK
jgi:hypothetical protein